MSARAKDGEGVGSSATQSQLKAHTFQYGCVLSVLSRHEKVTTEIKIQTSCYMCRKQGSTVQYELNAFWSSDSLKVLSIVSFTTCLWFKADQTSVLRRRACPMGTSPRELSERLNRVFHNWRADVPRPEYLSEIPVTAWKESVVASALNSHYEATPAG
jgi:hypothetical protein